LGATSGGAFADRPMFYYMVYYMVYASSKPYLERNHSIYDSMAICDGSA
jgi:hypothetical protein